MSKKLLFRSLLIIQALLLLPLLIGAQNFTGEWKGCVNYANNDCNINLEISTDESGQIDAVFNIPTQDISDLHADICEINNNLIIIELKSKGIIYKGEIKDNTIEGQWKQQGMSLALDFER